MSRRLIVRPEAELELRAAFNWYEDCTSGLGSDFLLCVDAVFHAIQRAPQQYPRVHSVVRRALIRRFPYEVFFLKMMSELLSCRSSMPSGIPNVGKKEFKEENPNQSFFRAEIRILPYCPLIIFL
jgi:hypothetical protein